MACSNPSNVLLSAMIPNLERRADAVGNRTLDLAYVNLVGCFIKEAQPEPQLLGAPANPPVG